MALVLVTGCGGVAEPHDATRTVNPSLQQTPTPVPQTEPDGSVFDTVDDRPMTTQPPVPAGIAPNASTPESEVNETLLYRTHVAALNDTSHSVTGSVREIGWRGGEPNTTEYHARIDWPRGRFVFDWPDRGDATASVVYWRNATDQYARRDSYEGEPRVSTQPLNAPEMLETFRRGGYLIDRIADSELRYRGAVDTPFGPAHLLTTTGADRRAAYWVDPDGVVRAVGVRYVEERTGGNVTVVEQASVVDVGNTTVTRPAWVNESR
ncbi:hypothetical protein [Halobaculum marinum]|uniref:Outer membrane lipoprotein-sorting protein n=1 Tax=Halobaculum marinum TaxID=3031996 RepID=A0ABD5WSZ9_9EURY|nr:hypothetical protein [Halobaculum sp. DT55]